MTPKQITFWALAFKVLWVVTLTQAGPRPWLSTAAVWLYASFCGFNQSSHVWRIIGTAILCSVIGDGTLIIVGVLSNPNGSALAFPPLWLIGLWAAFGALIPICFTWLYTRLWLAMILGAVSGVGSYISGGKLGALTVSSEWGHLIGIGLEWGIAFPLLIWIARNESV